MLRKIFRIISVIIGSFIALSVFAYAAIYLNMRYRITKVYRNVVPEAIHVTYDSASIALGGKIVGMRACADCHGKDFGGKTMIDDPLLGSLSPRT